MESWARLARITLTPFEIELIEALDALWLSVVQAKNYRGPEWVVELMEG